MGRAEDDVVGPTSPGTRFDSSLTLVFDGDGQHDGAPCAGTVSSSAGDWGSPLSVVLITGTSSGFGEAIAVGFAGRGDQVIATMRRPDEADPGLTSRDGIDMVRLDVTDGEGRRRVVEQVLAEHGRIDVLVNNAGIDAHSPAEEHPTEQARRIMETNFWGPYELIKLVLPAMRHQAAGRIVNITSIAAVMSPPFEAVYAASKHALDGLSASLDLELDGTGVRVVTVLPGPHDTGMQDRVDVLVAADSIYRDRLEGFHRRFSATLASNPELG
ncbi:MAG: SDR family oxidoreductase, partial [Ilumatobacteraceae bacterium]